MNWNIWIRQIHRWLSIIFTLTVVANFIAMALGTPPSWIVYSPLPFLFLMMFTGLYMFVLPYAAKWRSGRRTGASPHEDAGVLVVLCRTVTCCDVLAVLTGWSGRGCLAWRRITWTAVFYAQPIASSASSPGRSAPKLGAAYQ